jgi:palmitoyltransferase
MKCNRFVSVPVLSVFVLIGLVYYVTIFIFLEDWLGFRSSAGLLNALIFTALASLTIFSFFVCAITDPGGLPPAYVPDIEENHLSDQDPNRSGLLARKCDKCSGFKAPRSHHCRVCRRCVLRMDHHCLWINNCVGHRNYKAFVLLVFYATSASIYSSVITASCILQAESDSSLRVPQKIFNITFGVVVIGLSLTLGTFLGWHVYLMTHNMTTIEYYEGIRAAWLARKSGQSYRHLFDVGIHKNLSLILGPNMVKWLCPIAVSHIKDGTSFPTA